MAHFLKPEKGIQPKDKNFHNVNYQFQFSHKSIRIAFLILKISENVDAIPVLFYSPMRTGVRGSHMPAAADIIVQMSLT